MAATTTVKRVTRRAVAASEENNPPLPHANRQQQQQQPNMAITQRHQSAPLPSRRRGHPTTTMASTVAKQPIMPLPVTITATANTRSDPIGAHHNHNPNLNNSNSSVRGRVKRPLDIADSNYELSNSSNNSSNSDTNNHKKQRITVEIFSHASNAHTHPIPGQVVNTGTVSRTVAVKPQSQQLPATTVVHAKAPPPATTASAAAAAAAAAGVSPVVNAEAISPSRPWSRLLSQPPVRPHSFRQLRSTGSADPTPPPPPPPPVSQSYPTIATGAGGNVSVGQPAAADKTAGKPQATGLTRHEEKVLKGIKHELDRLDPRVGDAGQTRPQGRKLRSQQGSRYKSELSRYFPDYDEVIGNNPKEHHLLNVDTPIVVVDSTSVQPEDEEDQVTSPAIRRYGDELFTNLVETNTLDFSNIDAEFDGRKPRDTLPDSCYALSHKRSERLEKTIRNTERGRALHERDQIIRHLNALQGHDWLRVMGVNGVTEGRKKEFEPARQHFINGCRIIIDKFRYWTQEEKRRKLEKDRALAEESEDSQESEEHDESVQSVVDGEHQDDDMLDEDEDEDEEELDEEEQEDESGQDEDDDQETHDQQEEEVEEKEEEDDPEEENDDDDAMDESDKEDVDSLIAKQLHRTMHRASQKRNEASSCNSQRSRGEPSPLADDDDESSCSSPEEPAKRTKRKLVEPTSPTRRTRRDRSVRACVEVDSASEDAEPKIVKKLARGKKEVVEESGQGLKRPRRQLRGGR